MHDKKIVAIFGRGQSGKSTLANMLKAEGFRVMSFAEPLKKMLFAMGVEHEHLYGTDAQKNEPLEILCGNSARKAMQTLGTEWRETLSRNLWTNHMYGRIYDCSSIAIAIDDARFEHEYMMLKNCGAICIGIERPGQGVANSTHASETWDFKSTGMPVIQNDGTLEELWAKVQVHL